MRREILNEKVTRTFAEMKLIFHDHHRLALTTAFLSSERSECAPENSRIHPDNDDLDLDRDCGQTLLPLEVNRWSDLLRHLLLLAISQPNDLQRRPPRIEEDPVPQRRPPRKPSRLQGHRVSPGGHDGSDRRETRSRSRAEMPAPPRREEEAREQGHDDLEPPDDLAKRPRRGSRERGVNDIDLVDPRVAAEEVQDDLRDLLSQQADLESIGEHQPVKSLQERLSRLSVFLILHTYLLS